MFQGFTDETVDFMWGIRFNNERTWFEANKQTYLDHLYRPMKELGDEVYDHIAGQLKDYGLIGKVSRIYRDARRLFGRGPYKEAMWFTLRTWEKPFRGPSFWFELRASRYSCGMGFFDFSPEQMAEYRAYIDANPAHVERLAKDLLSQDTFHLDGENYKRPKASKGEPLDSWYNKKWISVEYTRDFGGDI